MILSNIDVLMSYYISTVDRGYIHESVSVIEGSGRGRIHRGQVIFIAGRSISTIRSPGRGISISITGRSIITIRGPGRGISIAIAGRSISTIRGPGRGVSTVGRSLSICPWLGGYLDWFPRTHILNNTCVNNQY